VPLGIKTPGLCFGSTGTQHFAAELAADHLRIATLEVALTRSFDTCCLMF